MIKQLLTEAGLAPLAIVGLLTFVVVFVTVAAWAFSRSRGSIARWSSLPLADGHEPVEPLQQTVRLAAPLPIVPLQLVEPIEKKGCGKCENCTC